MKKNYSGAHTVTRLSDLRSSQKKN